MGKPLTFEQFSEMNRRRCESYSGFGEGLDDRSPYTPAHWLLSVMSELGEAADALLGAEGLKKRRAGKTKLDAAYEAVDQVIYLDLFVSRLGFNLGELLVAKFNGVTDRAGFPPRFKLANGEPCMFKGFECVRGLGHEGSHIPGPNEAAPAPRPAGPSGPPGEPGRGRTP